MLSRRDLGEADLIVTLYTEELGKVSTLARGARRSQKRFGGSLEPMHPLFVVLEETDTSDLLRLCDSKIESAHTRLIARLDCIQSAGTALRWVRQSTPTRTPEGDLYANLSDLLARLNDTTVEPSAKTQLAEFGLSLLSTLGWGLDLKGCVRCGTPCPREKSAVVSPLRGGLVCQKCGSGSLPLSAPLRQRLIDSSEGRHTLEDGDAELALELVEQCLMGHVGESAR